MKPLPEISDLAAQSILQDMEEGRRLRALSNQELVREHKNLCEDEDDELYILEFWTRLWPGWAGEVDGH